jgi:cell division protein FtsW (lipid II flippase)
MSQQNFRDLATRVANFATALLPTELKVWGLAMRHEVDAIPTPAKAISYAMGCLFFALRHRFVFAGKQVLDHLVEHPSQMVAWCASVATGLGLVHLAFANAPLHYLLINGGAFVFGLAIVGILTLVARGGAPHGGTISLLLSGLVMLTSLFGMSADGATRWITIGGFVVQTSFLFVPVIAIIFARQQTTLTTFAIALTALALAIQPDRGMSGALAAGMMAMLLVSPRRTTLLASGASVSGLIATMVQVDQAQASAYVDHIYFSAFSFHPIAGIAVWIGAATLLLPAIIGSSDNGPSSKVFLVFGTVWGALTITAALGNYPTPIVGYGGSAILGYVMCILGFWNPLDRKVYDKTATSGSNTTATQPAEYRVAPA